MAKLSYLVILLTALFFVSCFGENETDPPVEDTGFFSMYDSRDFKMGFTSWSFGPNLQDVEDTYDFIEANGDIYTEHIDNQIPWNAWMNDLSLPAEFVNEIQGRANRRMTNRDLLLSVSLLNSSRNELAPDFDGSPPQYESIGDDHIVNAYFKHVDYLVDQFDPEFLVVVIEANELLLHAPEKWEGYKSLANQVKNDLTQKYPNLTISQSVTLHNLIDPETENPNDYIDEIINHMNQMELVTISFYPFFKNLHTKSEFQEAFDLLHEKVNKPIAFVETSHLAEDLVVESFSLNISGSEEEQNIYLQTLLENAQEEDYEFVIWWAHRDFDTLWETFPDDVKDLGKLWRDTGLLNENGVERTSFNSWTSAFSK